MLSVGSLALRQVQAGRFPCWPELNASELIAPFYNIIMRLALSVTKKQMCDGLVGARRVRVR